MTDYQHYQARVNELQQELVKWALDPRSHIDCREYNAVKAELNRLRGKV